jgi:hypothetical protein
MATRECLSSAARYHASVSADAIFEKPYGSKTLPPVSGPVPSLPMYGGERAREPAMAWHRARVELRGP